MSDDVLYLAGDVGGTNTRLTLVRTNARLLRQLSATEPNAQTTDMKVTDKVLYTKVYPSQDYNHLNTAVNTFLVEAQKKLNLPSSPNVSVCALAVAGPVHNNTCTITNLNWYLDASQMSQILRIPKVVLLNDFVAVGYGLLALRPQDVEQLNPPVVPHPTAPMACIGAGTGLGETFLTHDGKDYVVWPSEGGHKTFAARDDTEFGFRKYLKDVGRLPSVSVERVVSGQAIPQLYDYLSRRNQALVSEKVTQEIKSADDSAAAISMHAQKNTDALCSQVMDVFVKCYGAEAGNLALTTLPLGGLYLAGGIAMKNISLLKRNNMFIDSMQAKGRLRSTLEKVPVYVVKHKHVGLLGSRVICHREIVSGTQIKSKL